MNTFKTTIVNVKSKTKAECTNQAALMKICKNNQIQELTVAKMVNQLKDGYSFHPGIYDLNAGVYLSDKVWEGQQVFAADVDHANLSLEDLQQLLAKCPVPFNPAIIYESHSSSSEEKKYRLVFIADKLISDVEDALKIQKYLVVLFGQDYASTEKVDFSCVNSSRLFFGTTAEKIVSCDDVQFDIDALLNYIEENNLMSDYDQMWETNRPFHSKSNKQRKSTTKTSKKNREVSNSNSERLTLDELVTRIEDNLKQLSEEQNFDGEILDYHQGYEFINSLPLTKILGWELESLHCCILHDDHTPSAHIIKHSSGAEVYHCFGCMELDKVHGTFDVIHKIFNRRYKDTLMATKERICELLGVELGSKYQRKAVKELEFARKHINKLADQKDTVASYLVTKKLLGFYFQMLNIGKDTVTFFPLTNDEERCATFFISYSAILKECCKVGLAGCRNKQNIESKMNKLVTLGLIEKVDDVDVREEFMKRTQLEKRKRAQYLLSKCTQEEIEQHILELCLKNEAELLDRVTDKVKRVTYYRIPFLTADLLEKATGIIEHDTKYRVKSNGKGVKQTALLRGHDVAKTVYQQTEMVLSKADAYFIREADKAIDMLIEKQGYFTEDQLLFKIDARSRYFKGENKHKIKKNLADKFLPYLIKSKKMTSISINKASRAKFNVDKKVTNKYMYVLEEE